MAKLFIPTELLEKLVCLTCKNSLSIFPIFTKTDGSGGICGRCKVTEDGKCIRDEAYEGIAQFLIFPCIYFTNGCKEHFTPLKLEEHEQCCEYRKYDCPSKEFSQCPWQGPRLDLVAHFETNHAGLLLKDSKFELNFVNSEEENFLLTLGDEMFILKKEIDARKELFACSVQHLKSSENSESYNYFLRIESGNKNYVYKSPEKSTSNFEETRLTAEFLKELLHDPATIVVNIEITKARRVELLEAETKVTDIKKNANINWEMLSEIECPVCYDFMLPPIFQCINGHSICQNCKARVQSCPMCKKVIQDTQNFVLEKMTQYLEYPCKFYKSGCSYSCKATQIMDHEHSCEFGPYDCPLKESQNCQWKANRSELNDHIDNNHNELVMKTDKVDMSFNKDQNTDKSLLIKFSKRIFKLYCKYTDKKFYWTVQLVGPTNECKKYKFEIDIVDYSDDKRRFFFTGLVVPLALQTDSFQNPAKYLMLTFDQVESFIKSTFSYRVRIIKN